MPHLDLGSYLADDALVLDNVPVGDGVKSYTVRSPSAKFTLQLRRMMELWGARETDTAPSEDDIADLVALTTGDDGQPVDFRKRLLGDCHDQMIDDGISGERLQMITNIVMAHYGSGAHVAEAIVAGLGEPEAPNRKTRRTRQRKAGSSSSQASTGTRGRTPSQASTRSSTSPSVPEAAAAS